MASSLMNPIAGWYRKTLHNFTPNSLVWKFCSKAQFAHGYGIVCSEMEGVPPFHDNATFHVETRHSICYPNQMTGFYMKCNTGLK